MAESVPPMPPSFHVMVKPRGAVCDLACGYCYYRSRERLYPGSDFRMTYAVLETFTRAYLAAQAVPEAVFGWQGGEPLLMGLDFFRRAVELQRRHRPPGMRVLNTLQTNGTHLDDVWCRFLREEGFLVGISLDGPAAAHDAYRRDRAGGPTHAMAMDAIARLRASGVGFNVLACVHAANAASPLETYRFLRDEAGARFLQFIPVVERAAGGGDAPDVTARSVTGKQYGAFLCAVFDEWVRRDVGRVFVQHFDAVLAAWVGRAAGLCVLEETCGLALALEHNGDLFSCDHFVEPRHRLGNVMERPLAALVRSAARATFGAAKRDLLPASCRACAVRFACHGGCPKDRFGAAAAGEPGSNVLCDGYRAFLEHAAPAMRYMADALRRGDAPAGIMRSFAPAAFGAARRRP